MYAITLLVYIVYGTRMSPATNTVVVAGHLYSNVEATVHFDTVLGLSLSSNDLISSSVQRSIGDLPFLGS